MSGPVDLPVRPHLAVALPRQAQLGDDPLPHPVRRSGQRVTDPALADELDGPAQVLDLGPAAGAATEVVGDGGVVRLGRQRGEDEPLGVGVRRAEG